MPRQFKQARQINKLKMTEAADKLGISQPMLNFWAGQVKTFFQLLLQFHWNRCPCSTVSPFGLRNMDGCWSMRLIGC